jgi:hypothetical protein
MMRGRGDDTVNDEERRRWTAVERLVAVKGEVEDERS